MKLFGNLLILLGLADFALWNFADIDVYGQVGIQVPADIWSFTPFIAGGLGLLLRAIAR